jgi:predicted RNA-binding Zn ribbon-like protein
LIFAHDTELALGAAAALVNACDDFETPADLERFLVEWRWSGRRAGTRRELDEVRALVPRLRSLWSADDAEAAELVNALLVEAHALPQLVKHDEWDWHLHATSSDAALVDRIAVEAAMAMVDVIRMGELDRLHVCAADDCDDVLVDLSRNRSRRFCDGGCGNRANVAAYRERHATGRS